MNPPIDDDDDDDDYSVTPVHQVISTATNQPKQCVQRKSPPLEASVTAENPSLSSLSAPLLHNRNENDPPLFNAGRYKKLHKLAVLKTTMKLPYESYHFDYSGIKTLDDWFELVELHQLKLHQQQQAKEQKQLHQPAKKKPKNIPPPTTTVNPRTVLPGIQIRTHYRLKCRQDYEKSIGYTEVTPIERVRHQKFLWQFINIILYKVKHESRARLLHTPSPPAPVSPPASAAPGKIDNQEENHHLHDSDTHNDIHFRNLMKQDHLASLVSIHNQVAISHMVILELHVHTQSEAESLIQSITTTTKTAPDQTHHNSNVVILPTTWFHTNELEPRSITSKLMYQNDSTLSDKKSRKDTTVARNTNRKENTMGFIYDQLKPFVLSFQQWENENYPLYTPPQPPPPSSPESKLSAVVDHEVVISWDKSRDNRFLEVHLPKNFTMMELNEARQFIKPYEIQPENTTDGSSDCNNNMTSIDCNSKVVGEEKPTLLPFVRHHYPGLMVDRNTPIAMNLESASTHQRQEFDEWDEPVDTNRRRIFAIDCEMVETEMGKELARVTVCEMLSFDQVSKTESIEFSWDVQVDAIVQPYNHITNYLTQYSGISATTYHDADNRRFVAGGLNKNRRGCNDVLRLEQVQAILLQLIHPCDIVIGHSFENDLHALRFIHPTVVDTAIMFQNQNTNSDNDNNTSGHSSPPSSSSRSFKYSLRHLAAVLLQKEIQNANGPHCSKEDATTAMQLAVYRAVYGPSFGINNHKGKGNNWFTKISHQPKNALTTVAVGPIEWLREHVLSPSSSNAIHALQCESIDDNNSKAIVRWVTGPTRRASVVWSKMELSKSSKGDSNALNRMIEWILDVIIKLSSNNSVVLMIPIQINFNGTKELNQQRQLRQCNPRSTMPWSDAEEQQYQESLEICRNGYVAYITAKHGYRVLDFYGEVNATFGSKVSISGDGNTFLVSSVQSKSEYVLVYKFDSLINNYSQIGSFLVGNASDVYDAPMSISGDGSTFVVGAPKSDFGNRDSFFSAGYVRVYKLDSSINSYAQFGLDIMAQEGDGGFGISVSMPDDGATFVVSAATKGPYVVYEPYYTIVERIARGLTRVYKLDSTLNAYTQVGSDIFAFNIFSVTGNGVIGSSVSISADGTTFVVGTYNQFGAGRGLVDVYKLNSSLSTYSKVGSTIDEFDFSSVSMSADGLTFVMGSTSYMCINPSRFYCGYVRVYKLDALKIAYKQYGDTIYGEPDDLLGYSVSISADGTTFAADTNALTAGYVRVYTVSSLEAYTQFNPSAVGNGFGKVVSMSEKGVPFVVSSLSNGGGVDTVSVYLDTNDMNCCFICFLCKKSVRKCGLFCRLLIRVLFKNL